MATFFINQPIELGTRVNVIERTNNYKYIKRAIDFSLAIISIIIFSPSILIIYLLIKAQHDGPAIFKQERIGYKGRKFILYKFRTMTTNAEKNGKPQLCKDNDNRLTKVGKFLREHHLDEFPQLWNVVKGDMSFVGHRPERKYFIDQIIKYNENYELLYQLRPVLFSEATLYNGYTDTIQKMLKRLDYDLDYLNSFSFAKDIQIIYLVSLSIITGKKF